MLKVATTFVTLQLLPISQSFSLISEIPLNHGEIGFVAASQPPVGGTLSTRSSSSSSSWSQYERKLRHLTKGKSTWTGLNLSSSSTPAGSGSINFSDSQQNTAYINGLLQNLSSALDKWIVSGSIATRTRAYNIMKQIERESTDEELAKQAERMVSRAGMPLSPPPPASETELNKKQWTSKVDVSTSKSSQQRKLEADERKAWEAERSQPNGAGTTRDQTGTKGIGQNLKNRLAGRSALSSRLATNSKPDIFMPSVEKGLNPVEFANSKKELEDALESDNESESGKHPSEGDNESSAEASFQTSELVARAGAGSAFSGETLGIGGLDDVLSQVKRRIWVPLAAPPTLLKELGINPVRGLLLYGLPGCGKTLLARSLGKILSPARPITVISGPEVMDKFVGSSEANLRKIFDSPPNIYDSFRIGTSDDGDAISKAALHVIILDEFDAMARTRGGSGGKGEQGDAGVARDSVVNQLLAKMDGVDSLPVPTLVIGLTNKRTLIEPALLRPGRFEVQIEVPPPRTVAQRVSILDVHMKSMYNAGRVLVRDAPVGTAADLRLKRNGYDDVPTYNELLDIIAIECDGFSGASLAGVARAAASRALERAVCDFAGSVESPGKDVEGSSIADCLVTKEDFENAIEDVIESSSGGDGGEDSSNKNEDKKPDIEDTAKEK